MNIEIARKVLEVIDAGLVSGVGEPIPGQMCVEAAVCYALGEPHGDKPSCVAPALRALKIKLNDASWSSDEQRTKGIRRLGIAQLGSAGALDEKEFVKRCATLSIRTCVPNALRAAASLFKKGSESKEKLLQAADLCEKDPTPQNAYAARAAADAADAADAAYAADAARDKALADYCEGVVQILIEMKAPGVQWLFLTELGA
jgi:hypothetical protein